MNPSTLDPALLAGCNLEPIHIPGAIQPHGALVVMEEPALTCLQASENFQDICGIPTENLLNRSIEESFGPEAGKIHAALQTPDPALESPLSITIGERHFDCLLHRHDGLLIAEFEPSSPAPLSRHHRQLQRAIAELRQAPDLASLHQIIASFVANLTGYERVMVYQFDTDWHGEVVGERLLSDEVDSYMGHHFPASDIPAQARELYTRSWLRIIPNSSYRPAPLQPPLNPITQRPTDLSFSVLRSVSPVHLEYLRNMEVGASMSISLIVGGKLWGLVACHHRTPRPLPYSVRSACEIFGQVASLEIAAKQDSIRLAELSRATRIQTRFFDFISREQNFVEALIKYTPELLEFMRASGALICVNEQLTLLGATPSEIQCRELINWLKTQRLAPLLATDHLSQLLPSASAFTPNASGILALRLSRVDPQFIVWFRPEVVTTVTWAGQPNKEVDPQTVLHPRKSFAAWKEIVLGHSLPWNEVELQGASELLAAVNALVLRRTERLIRLNTELERKNTDLNSFAYIASHDLKEPLRGISRYSGFIREDYASSLPSDAIKKLETIADLAAQSVELLDALNHFSKLGRMEVTRKEASLDDVLDKVLSVLNATTNADNLKIIRRTPLPVWNCDPVLVREVLFNLISNSIRYNTNALKVVEIGVTEPTEAEPNPAIFVRDNGIGIRPKHHHAIFDIFRRLHAHGEFGTGTGAGLAITKSIIERHGGRIWLESEFGSGSTFYFTLH